MNVHMLTGQASPLLADAAVLLHFGYLAFLTFGGFLVWRSPRAIWPHLAAVAWAIGVVVIRYPCPLTDLERHFRPSVGERSFIERYLESVIYPEGHMDTARLVVVVVVAISYAGILRRRRPAVARVDD
ncbi:MAG: DUF2784 domain-containing protein [Actinomycetota bacterium]|nr:DUF2784 domain-containing protein [Actinomycetota bacterium]